MSDDKPQKVNIGFIGGQVLAARVSIDDLNKLRDALSAGGWHDLVSDDGTVSIDLAKVVYVHADHEASRVGFGS